MRERHSRSAARHRNDPTQAAPILAEVYVLHVSIKVAGGPGRKATVRTSSCHLPSRLAGEPQVPDRRHPHFETSEAPRRLSCGQYQVGVYHSRRRSSGHCPTRPDDAPTQEVSAPSMSLTVSLIVIGSSQAVTPWAHASASGQSLDGPTVLDDRGLAVLDLGGSDGRE
jgi:hypothetical protein